MRSLLERHYDSIPILIAALVEIKNGGDEPRQIAREAIRAWDKARTPKCSKCGAMAVHPVASCEDGGEHSFS